MREGICVSQEAARVSIRFHMKESDRKLSLSLAISLSHPLYTCLRIERGTCLSLELRSTLGVLASHLQET